MKTVAIEFIRQVLEQTLYEEHLKNSNYCGGENQVNLFSFYEQLVEGDDVDRYLDNYEELISQQNRSSLIMNGVITTPENPQIINIHTHDIRPMNFSVGFRTNVKNRDITIDTIENMMSILKGRKRDIALFENGKLFMVGTICNNVLGKPVIKNNDFIGTFDTLSNISTSIGTRLTSISTQLKVDDILDKDCKTLYFEVESKLYKATFDDELREWVVDEKFPYHALKFKKYKLSLSFDTTRIDEPRTMDGDELVVVSFGGSATLVSAEVELGNDLTKVSIKKSQIKAQTIVQLVDEEHYLEPLEMPNNLGIANELSQLASSRFVQGKQNTGINPTISYSFILDKSEPLIYAWWKYARYGIQGQENDSPSPFSSGVTPNTIYEIKEYWCSWGNVEMFTFYAKATENLEVENTESDAMSIKLNFEVQP